MNAPMHSIFICSLAGFMALAVNPALRADDAAEVFRQREVEIRGSDFTDSGGYAFARVTEPVLRDAVSRAFSKAELRAKERFLFRALGDPSRCLEGSPLAGDFARVSRALLEGRMDMRGVQVVFRKSTSAEVEIVCAIPQANLQGLEVSCEQLMIRLNERASEKEAPLPIRLLAYECVRGADSPAKARVTESLAARSPSLLGGKTIWKRLPQDWFRFEAQPMADTIEGALERASARPGDGQSVEALRALLVASGYEKSAELLVSPSGLPSRVPEHERLKFELEFQERIKTNPDISANARTWMRLMSVYGAALPVDAGAPVSVVAGQAFSSGELAKCISSALGESAPNAADWNLVSACLRELKAPHLAVVAARIARRLDPMIRYAQVNELLALRELGLHEEVGRQLSTLHIEAVQDEWSRRKLAELSDWIRATTPVDQSKPVADQGEPRPAVQGG